MTARSAPRRAAAAPWRSVVREVAPSDPVREFVAGWSATGRGFLWWRPAEGFAVVGTGATLTCLPHPGRPFAAVDTWWARARADCQRTDRQRDGDSAGADSAGADPATGPLLFCGVAFDPADERAASDPYWRLFPPAAAVLPAQMTTLRAGRAWRTVNTIDGPAPAEAAPPPAGAPVTITATADLPELAGWSRRVRRLTESFARGEAEKVVLARCKRVVADGPFSAEPVLRRLAAAHAESTVFAVGWDDRCFLGATPELLVSTRGTAVRSGPLAGSRPRGRTAAEDAALAAELLGSDKDRREHALVVDAVAAALHPLCRRV